LVALSFGFKAALFTILSALITVIMVETVNYIEHYGLMRKKMPDGTYEATNIRHSWNVPHVLTNLALFKL
jgi:alkane 1-monooxygenase